MLSFAHVRCNISDPHSGGFTIAFSLQDDRDERVRTVPYAIARCNPKDQFNKRLGRNIAKNRLFAPGPIKTVETRAKTYNGIVKALVAKARKEITAEYRNSESFKKSRKAK